MRCAEAAARRPYHMKKLLTRIVDVKPNELRALWLGFAFHFLILSGYYITKPIRDSIGASSSMEALPWMFTATLVTMLIANAAFAATVARMSRRKFIPLAYGFFIVVFTLFFIAMRSRPAADQVWIGREPEPARRKRNGCLRSHQ